MMRAPSVAAARHRRCAIRCAGAWSACSCCSRWPLTVAFIAGMQALLRGGWQGYVRPLVGDYVDRLAADLGTPPDVARAQALVAAAADGGAHRRPAGATGTRTPSAASAGGTGTRAIGSVGATRMTTAPTGWQTRTHGRRPPHQLRPRRCAGRPDGRARIGWTTLARAAAAHRARLRGRAPSAAAARRHPRRRVALRPRRVRAADPGAPRRRAGRPGRPGQHDGRRPARACSTPSARCCSRSATSCAAR